VRRIDADDPQAGPVDESQACVNVRKLRMGCGERVLPDNAAFDVQRGEIAVFPGSSGNREVEPEAGPAVMYRATVGS